MDGRRHAPSLLLSHRYLSQSSFSCVLWMDGGRPSSLPWVPPPSPYEFKLSSCATACGTRRHDGCAAACLYVSYYIFPSFVHVSLPPSDVPCHDDYKGLESPYIKPDVQWMAAAQRSVWEDIRSRNRQMRRFRPPCLPASFGSADCE